VYGSGENAHWLCTLADSVRVADDYGKFRLCYQGLGGRALIGMHGSFVVARTDVERMIGFDHGLPGSITEDSYFILVGADRYGARVGWIDAQMYEQSPFSAIDFAKQRSRWFCGIWLCVIAKDDISLKWRFALGCLCMLWMFSFVASTLILMIAPFAGYFGLPFVMAATRFACVWSYGLGFVLSFDSDRGGIVRFSLLSALQIIGIPYFFLLEGAGVLHGIFQVLRGKATGFYIVQKEKQGFNTSGSGGSANTAASNNSKFAPSTWSLTGATG